MMMNTISLEDLETVEEHMDENMRELDSEFYAIEKVKDKIFYGKYLLKFIRW